MILVDTGPLVALCDPRDRLHQEASRQLGSLAGRGLWTCDACLSEACFHLPHAQQRRRLRAVSEAFRVSLIDTRTFEFQSQVFEWLFKFAEYEPDWADACLAVSCGIDSRFKVWTFDEEFRSVWRTIDGRAIPLAARPRRRHAAR